MTAVRPDHATSAPVPPQGPPPGSRRPAGPADAGGGGPRSTHRTVAAIVVLAGVLLGALAGFASVYAEAPQYRSTATVLFTATENEDGNVSAGSRYVQDRVDSWAAIAPSESVRTRAAALGAAPGGTAFDPSTVQVSAVAPSGTELVEVTVTSTDQVRAPAEATYAAQALSEIVVTSERYPGTTISRVGGVVADPGGPVVDYRLQDGQWWAVLGAVIGFVVALTACTLLRPGPWARDIAPQPVRNQRRARDLNARVMGDELTGLVDSLRTGQGRVAVVVALVAVAGYGVTGLMVFPLLPVVAAGLWGWVRADARLPAAALIFTGIGVFPEKVDIVKLGPVTPTVLELALVVAVVVVLRQPVRAPRSAFSGPILGIIAAVIFGSVVALALGGDFSGVADNSRAILMVLGFFPVFAAFARRPHQLLSVLLVIAGFCSSVVILAAALGWTRLLVDERSSVITGSATDEVSRLSGPVLDLWGPLLIVLLSALVPRRPKWLWFLLVIIGVLHEALSFNRSTWAPLILLVVAVAAVTHGAKGLAQRVVALILLAAVGLTLAYTGLLGAQGRAIADRATSVVTGQAYGEDSLPDRQRENGAALITLTESPWVGTGIGQPYGGELITYDSEHSRTVVEERPYIHNQYLRIWLFMGIVGLFAYAFVGVRILALTAHSWWRRAAGGPMVVALAMGLTCLAAQSILQTKLVSRPAVLTMVVLMAAAAAFSTWSPRPSAGHGAPGMVPAPGSPDDPASPLRKPPSAWSRATTTRSETDGPPASPTGPRRPAPRPGTLEE